MTPSRPQRPSADVTRQKILKTASELFMQHGFAGTSMGKLAAKAGINQTLIFHHFGNKKQLWQAVKLDLLKEINVSPINETPTDLAEFLSEAITQRISIYTESPNLERLVSWQRLEAPENKYELWTVENTMIAPNRWPLAIHYLQQHNRLNPSLEPELVMIWLVSSIDGMLNDYFAIFKKKPEYKNQYVQMLITTLDKGLRI